MKTKITVTTWFARIVITIVFAWNLQCAFAFIVSPQNFLEAYALSGIGGLAAIQGLGIAFLMWNATYPVAIFNPWKYRIVFVIILVQQFIGLIGESFIKQTTASESLILSTSLLRFILFDGIGFVLMLLAYILMLTAQSKKT
ncbi:MAG: hypothetical protein FWE25_01150 [Lachnospiraceae bacterium]|nr:hypothetical protein [Lachnospiraceae bacterium]